MKEHLTTLANAKMYKANEEKRLVKIQAVEDALFQLYGNNSNNNDKAAYQTMYNVSLEFIEKLDEAITAMTNANYSEGYSTNINGSDVRIFYTADSVKEFKELRVEELNGGE